MQRYKSSTVYTEEKIQFSDGNTYQVKFYISHDYDLETLKLEDEIVIESIKLDGQDVWTRELEEEAVNEVINFIERNWDE
jgi:hypothetical protein